MSMEAMNMVWQGDFGSHTAKLVMLALADHANSANVCWPSVSTIADKCGMNRRSVIRQIQNLASKGYISCSKGKGKVTKYTLSTGGGESPGLVAESHQCHVVTSDRESPALVALSAPTGGGESPEPFITLTEPTIVLLPLESDSETGGPELEVFSAWAEMVANQPGGFPAKISRIVAESADRRKKVRKALKDSFWRENWRKALEILPTLQFARGGGRDGWVADFDWFVRLGGNAKSAPVVGIVEGKYANRTNGKPMPALNEKSQWEIKAERERNMPEPTPEENRAEFERIFGTPIEAAKA